ncbi:MAG: glycosyltransferase family 39 protein [Candidatus Brocadiales bacterium]
MRITRSYAVDYGLPLVLALAGVSLRVLFMRDFLGEWDEVDFALAMKDYDIIADQPHFPGYPIFIWLCQILRPVTHDDIKALTLTNALLGGLTTIPLYYLARNMYSQKVAILAVCLFITNPLCWLQSEGAMSDTTGLFFLLLSILILHRAYLFPNDATVTLPLGAALMGVTFGARLSYLPFLVFLGYILTCHFGKYNIRKGYLYALGALVLGTLVWLIPLVTSTAGLKGLSSQAVVFAGGHFTDWGGSAITSPDLFYRLEQILWCLFCHGLGLWWQDTSYTRIIPTLIFLMGIAVFLKKTSQESKVGLIFAMVLPYILWVFLAQNIEKPRHMLPAIPFVLICISMGILNISKNKGLVAILAVLAVFTTGISSLRLVTAQEHTPPPSLQLIDYVRSNFDKLSTRIYCGESKRLFKYYAPGWDARRVRGIEGLKYDLGASLRPPEVVLATSQVKGTPEEGVILCKFKGDRYIFTPYHEIVLYKINPKDL